MEEGGIGGVPEGYVRATHGGAFAASPGPFHAQRGEREIRLGLRVEAWHLKIRAKVTRMGGSLAFVEGVILADAARVGRASAVFSIRGSSLRLPAQPAAVPGKKGGIA